MTNPIAFIDLETTGTNIATDRICEIAITVIIDGKIDYTYHKYIDPEIDISPEASKVHGLVRGEGPLAGAKKFSEYAAEIYSVISGFDIAGHRIMQFDLPLLVEELLRAGIQRFPSPDVKFFDTYELQAHLFPRTLKFSYEQMTGKTFDDSKAHGAAYDTNCAAELFHVQQSRFTPTELNSAKEIMHNISTREKVMVDFAGKLKVNPDGFIVYNFGKHVNTRVSLEKQYASWMMGGEFTRNTKNWLHYCMKHSDNYQAILNEMNNGNQI